MGSVVFSSSYSHSGIGYSKCNVRINYSESYNQSTNATTVRITGVELQREGNSTNWGSIPFFGDVTVNGVTLLSMNGGASVRVSLSDGSYHSVAIPSSSSTTIIHDADGSKSITFGVVGRVSRSGSNWFCGYYNNQYIFGVTSQTKSVALTTHPRISSVSATDAYIGEPVTITLSRYNSAFTHTVKVTCAGNTETLMTKGSTYPTLSWTPALVTYAPLITNGMAATATITCETYNGDTLVGQSTTTCTLTLKTADVAPSVAIATADPTGNLTTYGKFVKTKSKIQVTATPTLLQGATLVSTSITANDATYNESPATTDFITSASNTSVSARIKDSRGQSASASATIQIYDYEAPQIVAMAAHRCNSDGTDNNAGAYFKVDYSVAITALGNHNSKSLKVKYKKRTASTYSEQTFTLSAYIVTSTTLAIAADTNSTYDVIIDLSDDFSTASFGLVLPTAATRMNWRQGIDGGIAIGKVCEYDKTLEVADDWAVTGMGFINLIYPVGSIYMSVNPTSPATLFGGTWVQIEDTFLLSAGQTYTAGDTGGAAAHQHTTGNHALTTQEMPIHGGHLGGRNAGTLKMYLKTSVLTSYGSTALGWTELSGSEAYPASANAGSGWAHNHGDTGSSSNLPPYLVVYIWKRTA